VSMFKIGDQVIIKNLNQKGIIVEIRKSKFKIQLEAGFGYSIVEENQLTLIQK
jgi:dsDNA-specific endonuclease/ATPase MutS2